MLIWQTDFVLKGSVRSGKQAEMEANAREQEAVKQVQVRQTEDEKNQELVQFFRQFDSRGISEDEATIKSLARNRHVCLKIDTGSSAFLKSLSELGAVLIAARFCSAEGKYLSRSLRPGKPTLPDQD